MKLFLGALFGVLAIPAFADLVPVTNFSFETLPASPTLHDSCGIGCLFTTTDDPGNLIPGWMATGIPFQGTGQFNPGVSSGTTSYYNSIPDGNWIAYLNGGNLTQTVGVVVAANTTYTLSVAEGLRKDFPNLGTTELLINGTAYVATGSAPTLGNWSTFTAVYNSALHPADVGSAITIELLSNTTQAGFDNVVLNKTANNTVPEPASIALLSTVLGVLGLTVGRRRRVSI